MTRVRKVSGSVPSSRRRAGVGVRAARDLDHHVFDAALAQPLQLANQQRSPGHVERAGPDAARQLVDQGAHELASTRSKLRRQASVVA